MFPSETWSIPGDVALLYDFLNSLDARHYVEQGEPHTPGDALATPAQLQTWMRKKGLRGSGHRLEARDHARVVALRQALRAFVQLGPGERAENPATGARLSAVMAAFPMTIGVTAGGIVSLQPATTAKAAGIGQVLTGFHRLAETGRLERLKMCASEECGWVFYDRSKPGNRRWCSSTICGNREKTRSYRDRHRHAT